MTRRPDLIPDTLASAAFLSEVAAPTPRPRLHALGGSGVLLRFWAAAIAIDPYLGNTLGDREPDAPPGWRDRDAPPPVSPQTLTGLSAILVSHGHGDHFDPPTLRALLGVNPGVSLLLPRTLREQALALGADAGQLIHPPSLIGLDLMNARVTAVPAAHVPPDHPVPQPDGQGGHQELGYLIELGQLRLYHAGDTVVYPGLPATLDQRVDLAVLPVNGRRWAPLQPARLGNMTAEEAADLAGLCGMSTVMPVHHRLLGSSAGGLQTFLSYAAERWPGVCVTVLEPGESLTF